MLGWFRRWKKERGSVDAPPPEPASKPEAAPRPTKPAAPVAAASPRVIPRAEHPISRKHISVNALKVMNRLIQQGYKGYLVGGCLRDLLVGKQPKDFDVVTDAHPNQVHTLFRNSRLIGRRFRLVHVFFHGGEVIEVSTFRRGIPFDPDAELPAGDENTFGTPQEDAFRRDLTINALFYDLQNFALYDYVGGLDDIRRRAIRAIGEPNARFREDPIRMLRTIRHAVGTGFAIEPVTLAALRAQAGEIVKANPSRLRDEFLRDLTSGRSRGVFDYLLQTGLLAQMLPSFRPVFGDNGQTDAARAHLLANLGAVDEAVNRGRELPLSLALAAMLTPVVQAQSFSDPADGPAGARRETATAMREFIKTAFTGLAVSRAHVEAVAMAFVGQQHVLRALSRGGLSRNVTRKSYFLPAVQLMQIEARGKHQRLPQPLFESARERNLLLFAPPSGATRRRGRRRRRRPDAEVPAPDKRDPVSTLRFEKGRGSDPDSSPPL